MDEPVALALARLDSKLDRLADSIAATSRELTSAIISSAKQSAQVTEFLTEQVRRHETGLNKLRGDMEHGADRYVERVEAVRLSMEKRVEKDRAELEADMDKRDAKIEANRRWLVATAITIVGVVIALGNLVMR